MNVIGISEVNSKLPKFLISEYFTLCVIIFCSHDYNIVHILCMKFSEISAA